MLIMLKQVPFQEVATLASKINSIPYDALSFIVPEIERIIVHISSVYRHALIGCLSTTVLSVLCQDYFQSPFVAAALDHAYHAGSTAQNTSQEASRNAIYDASQIIDTYR